MKRSNFRPIILTLPIYEMHLRADTPRILPFPDRQANKDSTPVELRTDSSAELSEIRDRLFRMIVSNEWDRSHGNRAS